MKHTQSRSVRYLQCGALAAFLLTGVTAIAQEIPNTGPDSNKNTSPGQMQAGSLLTAVRLPEVLSDSLGVDFAPYFRESVLPPLRENWRLAARQNGLAPTTVWKIVAEFAILKDGSLEGLKLAESSGDPEADQVALDAIAKTAPFTALPDEFKGQSLTLRCRLNVFIPRTNGATPPHLISPHAEPEYSDKARRKRIQGGVLLALLVTADGKPTDIHVTRPLGNGLDEEAVKTVRQWRFTPAMKDGNPVIAKISVEVNFHLY
jgi:TonB family protein